MNNRIETTADLVSEIREHIRGTILIGLSDQEIDPDESFIQRGILHSTGVLELISILEQRFGITVEDTEITTDNLDSLNSIASYLWRKLKVA